ncbi:MAG: A24 family peptidase [Planctomycetota bacterium]
MFSWIDLIPVLIVAIAAGVDLRSREIPDRIWLAILVLIPVRVCWLWPEINLWQLPVGGIVALLLACLIAQGDRFGGGDVKLFAALGAWFGLFAILPLALWIAIAGLPLAVIALLRKQEDFAYGPAILIGVLIHALNPNLLKQIVSP